MLSADEGEVESDVVLMLSLFVLGMLLLLPGGVSCAENELGGVLLLPPDPSVILSLLSLSFPLGLSLVCLRDFWPSLDKDPPKHKADFSYLDTSSCDAGGDSLAELEYIFGFLMGDFCQTLRGIDTLPMSSELKNLTVELGWVGDEDCECERCDELLLHVELLGDDIAGAILLFRCCRRSKGSSR